MSDNQPEIVLTLYTGVGCHLCDMARDILDAVLDESPRLVSYESVTITGDETLMAVYGERIPVVRNLSGQEKAWPFTEGQIKRLLGL